MADTITPSAGYLTITRDGGIPVRYSIKSLLRAADIPTGLTYAQVGAITTLANLVVVLIRTLIDRKVLDESFGEGDGDLSLDLEHLIRAIEEMGGAYHDPDLTVA